MSGRNLGVVAVEYRLSTRKGVSEGLILDLSSAESTTAVKATGPNIAGEPLTTLSLYGGLAYFAIVGNLWFGTRQQLLRPAYFKKCANQLCVGQANSTSQAPELITQDNSQPASLLARNSIESRRLRFETTVSGHKRVCRY